MKSSKQQPDNHGGETAHAANDGHAEPKAGRRSFLKRLGISALLISLAGQAWSLVRALVPNVIYEEPRRFKVGSPGVFAEGVTFLEEKRLFIFKQNSTFYAISANCPHLGCTVKIVSLAQPKAVTVQGSEVQEHWEFQCPCHGSRYHSDGTIYSGPSPRSLSWVRLEVAPEDGQLVVNLTESVSQNFKLTV